MTIKPVPATSAKVHIYELSNRTRLESLLAVTAEDSAVIAARLRREPPPQAASWQPSDEIETIILAQHMIETSAELFLKMHLEHMQQRTWRFSVWRP